MADGGTVDLDDFRTRKLVVFVCPHKDHKASAKDISDYEALLPDFAQAGVWVVGIAAVPGQIREVPRHMRLALDCDGAALLDLADWARIEPRPIETAPRSCLSATASSPFRSRLGRTEALFGGVTRRLLQASAVPLLIPGS